MLEGIYVENILMFPMVRAYPIHPVETSGIVDGSQAIYRYSLRDSDYPILTIVDEIADTEGNKIAPGHYELAISDEKDFLILMQTKNPIAIIPVFKVQEDKHAYDQHFSKSYLKRQKKIQQQREKTNEKRKAVGMLPDEDKVYMEASIEYIKDGDYWLLKYERGPIRAWGAIKSK